MQTKDLSPRMIGHTIRIHKTGIAGTHNYLEGVLQDYDFYVEEIWAISREPARYTPVSLRATIAGLPIDLDGSEPLTVIDWEADRG